MREVASRWQARTEKSDPLQGLSQQSHHPLIPHTIPESETACPLNISPFRSGGHGTEGDRSTPGLS